LHSYEKTTKTSKIIVNFFILSFISLLTFNANSKETTVIAQPVSQTELNALKEKVTHLELLATRQAQDNHQFEQLAQEIKLANKRIDIQDKAVEYAVGGSINQLQTTLNTFSLILAILSIGLGFYINKQAQKVIDIRQETQILKNDMVVIKNQINEDIDGLFIKLKSSETDHILKRIEKHPQDIGNFFSSLATRELKENDFLIFKNAFSEINTQAKIKGVDTLSSHIVTKLQIGYLQKTSDYSMLFIQHFFGKSIFDTEILQHIQLHLPAALENGNIYKEELIHSSLNFVKHLIARDFIDEENIINWFLNEISAPYSTYKTEVFSSIFQSLSNTNNRFKFYSKIEDKSCKKTFGELLESEHGKDSLTEPQKTIISEINSL